jgi:hypothetical protein
MITDAAPWKSEPIFCLTSDVDWASDPSIRFFHESIHDADFPISYFITNKSEYLSTLGDETVEFGIHPNFLPGSSHGDTFDEVISTCLRYLSSPAFFRCHKYFDVDDTIIKLLNVGCKFDSNLCTLMDTELKPLTHRLGHTRLPIFWEDGAHLTHRFSLDFSKFDNAAFLSPGLKILNMHPMHYALNTPTQPFARSIKDSTERSDWNSFSDSDIKRLEYKGMGIRNFIDEMLAWIRARNFTTMTLTDIYNEHTQGRR